MGIEKKFPVERGDEEDVRVDALLEAFQRGECRGAIRVCPREGFLKSVVAGEDGRGAADLFVMLLDQLLEDPGAAPQTGVNLRAGVLPVRVPDEKVARTLQEREESDEEEKQPAAEAAEAKFQG